MTAREQGNAAALRTHKAESAKATRQELELAIRRIVNGNPKKVKKGTALSPASVAQEAGVDRTTLYRYHEPVLTEIRRITDAAPQQKLREKSGELATANAKAKEYRELLEAEQANSIKIARENYDLLRRVRALEATTARQAARIVELEEAQKKVTSIASAARPRGSDHDGDGR